MEIKLNASVRNEHAPEINRINRTMKEHIQSVYTEIIQVYSRVPVFLVCKLIFAVTFWINIFPADGDI